MGRERMHEKALGQANAIVCRFSVYLIALRMA